MERKAGTIFQQGAVPQDTLMGYLQRYGADGAIGAYACFMGQVRADRVDGREVTAIAYTAYESMADEAMREIAAGIRSRYGLLALEVRHSLGVVPVGQVCLFVLAASGHRKAAMAACEALVERIKSELPIWGKELFADEGYQWKINQ